jgi:septum formation protein
MERTIEKTTVRELPIRKLILASASPRRRELLQEAGYTFVVFPAENVDETYLPDRELPWEHVVRLAREKAGAIVRPRRHSRHSRPMKFA